jgi:hypothetical protein
MSQSTDELTRSELRAIPGHYRRRVWLAFLIPALSLRFNPGGRPRDYVAGGW